MTYTTENIFEGKDIGSYWDVVEAVKLTISDSSQDGYEAVYKQWFQYCSDHNIDPVEGMNYKSVSDFLISHRNTKRTRSRKLSVLRTFARVLAALTEADRHRDRLNILNMVKMPRANLSDDERDKIVFTWDELDALQSVWRDDETISGIRNQALIMTLAKTGMRIGEASALKWSDIDFEDGIIRIRHGKGDKYREVAVFKDPHDAGIDALEKWYVIQEGVRMVSSRRSQVDFERNQYVFSPLSKGGYNYEDKPLSSTQSHDIVKGTIERVNEFAVSHTFRRTLLTRMIELGWTVADAQGQAGHSNTATTLEYMQSADARERRRKKSFPV